MADKKAKDVAFLWEGIDRAGKKTKGETVGQSEALVKAMLRRQGINPTKVRRKPKPLFGGARKKKIVAKDIAIFARQLATMMTAGVPLVQAFEIVGRGHDNPSMSDLILSVKADVEGGNALADALAKHPLHFDQLMCNLVRAGEQAGVLDTLLDKIATYKEKTESLKAKIKKALTYPTAVVVVAIVITGILLYFVIPQFASVFQGFGADLPAFTKLVIGLSEFVQEYWWIILSGIGGLVYGFIEAKKRSKKFNEGLDRLALQAPVVGDIMRKASIARFARTLSTMFAAGVPLVEAMDNVAGATGNIIYSNAVMKMRDEIATGQQLQLAMKATNLFPNMVVQMVQIGEESGALDTMLGKVADFYEEEVDNAVDALSSLLEPMIMAILGVVIGGLVIAMYLPIFKMGEAV